MGHQEANSMTPDVALQSRPTSGVSTWTANSRETLNSRNATQASTPFGSTDTLHIFDMDGTDAGAPYELQLYPHLQTRVTPISFNGLADDYPKGIIDLEDTDHQAGNGSDDSWLDANKFTFDAWYGMKPYNVMGSSSRKDSDAHVPNSDPVASGPTSSSLQTKQKLLYSRFARRPQSDSVLRMRGRPPLPPGNDVHLRPTSETQRKIQTFCRNFASDLDIR
ncbi:hypothetical protein DPMN_178756 [Dreissena polymorpha]|uniref:Uncharacterized protein n=1 Tax=Dreissena polymorpha TaxID=45954 RepID=A0A9D4ECS1_DREPO|nr:hypothetical protein DPMN_178756 [Dreissena polymorpha]